MIPEQDVYYGSIVGTDDVAWVVSRLLERTLLGHGVSKGTYCSEKFLSLVAMLRKLATFVLFRSYALCTKF